MANGEKQPGTINMIVFLLLFLVPAAFTYFSGVFFAGAVLDAVANPELPPDETIADDMVGARRIFLGICYVVMLVACIIRGRAVNRMWLVAFPIVGAIFDIWLAFIPFVPSVMNIAVLAAGIPQPSKN